ncbi:MAG: sterol desaturase [Flavobacteriales bacterium]|nr:sterol desaturase [Flavobacteriales bacterium]
MEALEVFAHAVSGYWNWIVSEVTFNYDYKPWYQNYFYGLIALSLGVWALELLFPWRKEQPAIRKDFWLDGFYMFFNFFIFGLVISGFYALIEFGLGQVGLTMQSLSFFDFSALPLWTQLFIFFILNDFVQWFTHVLLHRFPVLWEFHKVHHSVVEMGFAAHLRYHWMENILYKPLKTLAVMLIGGFEPQHAFLIHFIAIAIGHLNHANVRITWGPFKYIFNNSVMHLYHHAKDLPKDRPYGMNYGISLSLWDYIFGTKYIPQSEDGSYALGFPGIEKYPVHSFWKQLVIGFGKRS